MSGVEYVEGSEPMAYPEFPGVREAVRQLHLKGEERDGLFVHCVTSVAGTDHM